MPSLTRPSWTRLAGVSMAAMIFAGVGVTSARADLVVTGTGTGTDGAALSATADFSLSGGVLTIVLTNNNVAISNASVLTELLFNGPATTGALPGSSGSAAVGAGSSLVANGAVSSNTVGQNWQYTAGTGLGTTGIDFGPNGNLCGSAGCGVPVDGADFGIVGNNTNLTLDGMKNDETLIENSAKFTLDVGSSFTLSELDNTVSFVFGTGSGDEAKITCTPGTPGCVFNTPIPTPEPSALSMLGIGLVFLGLLFSRRRST